MSLESSMATLDCKNDEVESVIVPRMFNHIKTTNINDIYYKVKDEEQWVKPTSRVEEIINEIGQKDSCIIYNTFIFDHQVRSADQLWSQMNQKYRPYAVITGHDRQGKSQFLHFVLRVLQAMGEIVLYFDKTIIPTLQVEDKKDYLIDTSKKIPLYEVLET
jgi:hypothetical protein